MKPIHKEITFSALLFMAAFLLTCFIHESGHAFFVKYFSLNGTLYHNRVDWNYEASTTSQAVWVCLGGSIFTLVQFLIIFPLCLRLKSNNKLVQLFCCWFAFWSIITLFGYWMIGIIPTWNDIAGVYQLLEIPWWIRVLVAVLGFMLIKYGFGKLKYPFTYAMNKSFSEDNKKQAKAIILYPSFIATVILVSLQFPVKYIMSISYPASIPLFILSTYFRVVKDPALTFKATGLTNNQLIVAVLLFLMLAAVSIFFSTGIGLG